MPTLNRMQLCGFGPKYDDAHVDGVTTMSLSGFTCAETEGLCLTQHHSDVDLFSWCGAWGLTVWPHYSSQCSQPLSGWTLHLSLYCSISKPDNSNLEKHFTSHQEHEVFTQRVSRTGTLVTWTKELSGSKSILRNVHKAALARGGGVEQSIGQHPLYVVGQVVPFCIAALTMPGRP